MLEYQFLVPLHFGNIFLVVPNF